VRWRIEYEKLAPVVPPGFPLFTESPRGGLLGPSASGGRGFRWQLLKNAIPSEYADYDHYDTFRHERDALQFSAEMKKLQACSHAHTATERSASVAQFLRDGAQKLDQARTGNFQHQTSIITKVPPS
jgi:hypothetical protein